jgi:hypothetical protein
MFTTRSDEVAMLRPDATWIDPDYPLDPEEVYRRTDPEHGEAVQSLQGAFERRAG